MNCLKMSLPVDNLKRQLDELDIKQENSRKEIEPFKDEGFKHSMIL